MIDLHFPDELLYTSTHEWAKVVGDRVTIGITDYAQSELGDVTYLELPKLGDILEAGKPFGIIESVKADAELYAPVSGKVIAVNEEAIQNPEVINKDPYVNGWMIIVETSNPKELKNLMSSGSYRKMLEQEGKL